jgi:ABC-2 type transport system ATP-binding protein
MCGRVAFIKEGRIIKLEKMSSLQDDSYKSFRIEAKSAIVKEMFDMEGTGRLVVKHNTAEFIFKGNLNAVIRKIAEIEISNISIYEPDLEDIFMNYYAEEVQKL